MTKEEFYKIVPSSVIDTTPYKLNIIGFRSKKLKCTNKFDDNLLTIQYDESGTPKVKLYRITTIPGAVYFKNPINPKGTAILKPGTYKDCWRIGLHQGKYEALIQNKPVTVYRDVNRDMIIDLNNTEVGMFGINIHKAGAASLLVDKWSAGCQVFATLKDYEMFMRDAKLSRDLYGNSFTYTLIQL